MDDIRQIAKKVRKALEIFAHSHDSVEEDYHKDEQLGAMCAVASEFLYQLLSKHGFFIRIHQFQLSWMSHCFVVVNNDHVVDLTATQFKNYKRKVVIKPFRQYLNWLSNLHPEYIPQLVTPNWSKWPKEQQPRKEILEKLENIYAEL